jgi:hypothetical protein
MFIKEKFNSGECVYFGGLLEELQNVHFASPNEQTRGEGWGADYIKGRTLSAGVKVRMRKYRTFRKRVGGILLKRKWGGSWVEEEKRKINEATN